MSEIYEINDLVSSAEQVAEAIPYIEAAFARRTRNEGLQFGPRRWSCWPEKVFWHDHVLHVEADVL